MAAANIVTVEQEVVTNLRHLTSDVHGFSQGEILPKIDKALEGRNMNGMRFFIYLNDPWL